MTRDQGIQFRGGKGEGCALLAPERRAQLIHFSFAAANSASARHRRNRDIRRLRRSEGVDPLVTEIPSAADQARKKKKTDDKKETAGAKQPTPSASEHIVAVAKPVAAGAEHPWL